MRPYVRDYIETLSQRRQERVTDLLDEARVGKERIEILARRLAENTNAYVPVILGKVTPNRLIEGGTFATNANELRVRLEELFAISNLISLLLSSHSAILTADVKAIEDELIALEKMAMNYAFLLSDNQAYNYAHLEPFSDERGRETRFSSPDRGGLPFGPNEQATVRADEGVLSLPDEPVSNYGLTGRVVKGNATAYTVSKTALQNVFTRGNSMGWKLVIATAGPVTAALPEAKGQVGAQVLLEFSLSQPAPVSEIKLVPYADMAVELVQATVYPSDDDSQGENLLTGVRKLDRPFTLHFPMRSVARFRLLLNQPTYERITRVEKVVEHRYRQLIDEVRERLQHERQQTHTVNEGRVEGTVRQLERQVRSDKFSRIYADIPTSWAERGVMRASSLARVYRDNRTEVWNQASARVQLVYEMLPQSAHPNTALLQEALLSGQKSGLVSSFSGPRHAVVDTGFNYYYTLGLHYVAAGVEAPGFKGVFISTPVPASGDIGEVRLKASESNYTVADSDLHSKVLTSAEYAVTNHPEPIREGDWVPILPVDTYEVVGERFLPDTTGNGYLRFPANPAHSLFLYKNGYLLPVNAQDYILSPINQAIVGVKLAIGSFSTDDILTCDYTPLGDHTVISFENLGFAEAPLISAYDAGGAGEEVLSTGERNTVELAHAPYIDRIASQTTGYQPIVVRLANGEVAINLTDYKTGTLPPLPTTGYYYVQSGTTLMFNRPILDPFRVYYQYLQSNVRFRVVLRCNSREFVSPKVDYVHLKAKTRKADSARL